MVRSQSSARVSEVKSACFEYGCFAECADSARHNRNTIDQIKCPAVHILSGDVFDRLPAGNDIGFIPHFNRSGNGANFIIGKIGHQMINGIVF